MKSEQPNRSKMLASATRIAAAYLSNNSIPVDEIPALIEQIYQTLHRIEQSPAMGGARAKPAVPISRSIEDDFIICLEDGKRLKMLKRHLRTHYKMTPEDYRAKWGLPADYPMVAPNYAKKRRKLAKKIGLGTQRTSGRKKSAAKKRRLATV